MSPSQLSRLFPLRVQRDFHPREADLSAPPLPFRRVLPQTNCPPGTVSPEFNLRQLGSNVLQSGISLTAPLGPEPKLHRLPPMLRRRMFDPIPSCSKAPGVFSSNCR